MLKQSAKLKKIVLFSGLMAASTFAAAEDIQYGIAVPEVNAQTYVLMDYNSGAVLASLNPDQRQYPACLLYTSPSPRDRSVSRMPSSA